MLPAPEIEGKLFLALQKRPVRNPNKVRWTRLAAELWSYDFKQWKSSYMSLAYDLQKRFATKRRLQTMHVRFLVFALVFALLTPQFVAAQAPSVSSSELRQAMTTAAQTRQKNLADVRSFF